MGNDGGSIPSRRELTKTRAAPPSTGDLKASQMQLLADRWSTCPLSAQPLVAPIVSDHLGGLYNKSAVLELLLAADDEALRRRGQLVLRSRVKSLKDVVEVRFTEGEGVGGFLCPITGDKMGVGVKSVYLVPCGHAMSAVVVRQISADRESRCPVCEELFAEENVIPILSTDKTELSELSCRMEDLFARGLTHTLAKAKSGNKSSKKRKKQDEVGHSDLNGLKKHKSAVDGGQDLRPSKKTIEATAASAGIKNSTSASIVGQVLAAEAARKERLAAEEGNLNVKSLFHHKSQTNGKTRDIDFMNRGFALPKK